MKNKSFTLSILFLCFFTVFVQTLTAKENVEDYAYARLKNAKNSESWQYILQKSIEFQSNYPRSLYTDQVLTFRAKALQETGFTKEALAICDVLLGKEQDNLEAAFIAGQITFNSKLYTESLRYLYPVLSHSSSFYEESLFLCASSFIFLGDNKQAVLLLESFLPRVENTEQVVRITEMLLPCYYKEEKYSSVISYYESVPLHLFSQKSKEVLSLYGLISYMKVADYKKAFNLAEQLVVNSSPLIAVSALQYGYECAGYIESVSQEEFLDNAMKQITDYPEIVTELWIRSGIDRYHEALDKNKDFSKAMECFKKADPVSGSNLEQLSLLYQGHIAFFLGNTSLCDTLWQKAAAIKGEYTSYCLGGLAVLYYQTQRWDTALSLCQQLLNTGHLQEDLTVAMRITGGICAYQLSNYEKAVTLLEPLFVSDDFSGTEVQQLYAQSLFNSGNTTKSLKLMENLSAGSENLCIAYLRRGMYLQAKKIATTKEYRYFSGLSSFALGQYNQAALSFEQFLSQNQNVSAEQKIWASYYSGLSWYKLGSFQSALNHLDTYIQIAKTKKYMWNAHMMAGMSALQLKEPAAKVAVKHGLAAIEASETRSQRLDSVMFLGQLYIDLEKYDVAEKLLSNELTLLTEDTIPLRLLLAQCYANWNKPEKAEVVLTQIVSRFPNTGFARESAYRAAEYYYQAEKYEKATLLFTDFKRQYVTGLYADAALFYNADSYAHLGEISFALLQYEQLISLYPESTYRFASFGQIIQLSKEKGDYQQALVYAKQMIETFGDQARKAGIPNVIEELELLSKGTEKEIASLLGKWEQQGREKTVAGRKTGIELSALYVSSVTNQDKAKNILSAVLSQVPTESEYALFGKGYELQATLERNKALYIQAAESYLLAAEYYGKNGLVTDAEAAAKSLYGAAESFDQLRKKGDVQALYNQMKDSFPDSIWTVRVAEILGNIE
jgi:outer membrane protein assembly factor BamD (BamD/ComL family)